MRRLPESELNIMLAIWEAGRPVSRAEIEEGLPKELAATTVLSFLSRLCDKGFVRTQKQGKSNLYSPLISREEYSRQESKSIVKKLYGNSVKNFVAAFCGPNGADEKQLAELRAYLEELEKGGA